MPSLEDFEGARRAHDADIAAANARREARAAWLRRARHRLVDVLVHPMAFALYVLLGLFGILYLADMKTQSDNATKLARFEECVEKSNDPSWCFEVVR